MDIKEIRLLDLDQLNTSITGLEKELLQLRFHAFNNQLKDNQIISRKRKLIARINTVISEKRK